MKVFDVKNMALVDNLPEPMLKDLIIDIYDFNGKLKETFKIYEKIDKGYLIPRAYVEEPVKQREWEKVCFNTIIKLKDTQQQIFNSLVNDYNNGSKGGILHAKTGTGKTVIAIEFMKYVGLKTLIVVPTNYLLNQWIERLEQFSNIKRDHIGIIQGNRCDINKPVVIGIINSLSMKDYNSSIYKQFGLTIYDEGHLLGAKVFSNSVKKFWDKYRLILSATPFRRDNNHKIYFYHVGKIVASSNKYNAKPDIYVVRYFNPKLNDRSGFKYGKFVPSIYLNKIAADKDRNKLIATIIRNNYKKGRKILILSDRINQIKYISDMVKDLDIGFIMGSKKEPNHDIIFGTYKVAGLGLDLGFIDTLIFATPKTNIEQAIGRITRKEKYDKQTAVIDIVDYASEIMKKYFYKRNKWYKNQGFKVKIKDNIYKGGYNA